MSLESGIPIDASMKVPPKRKGNLADIRNGQKTLGLNESPSQKEGKFFNVLDSTQDGALASMKVPPKRKGNLSPKSRTRS